MPESTMTFEEALKQLEKPFDPYHRDLAALRVIILHLIGISAQAHTVKEAMPGNPSGEDGAEKIRRSSQEESQRKRVKGKKD